MYREDYGRAGIRMLPVVEPSGESTARQILIYSTLLIPVSLIPRWLEMAGNWYLAAAIVLGLYFVGAGIKVAIERTNLGARGVLLASVVYLPLLLGMMVVDHRSF
jgi:protoheme IX farnesyltransferase